jgi:hypothetical protein
MINELEQVKSLQRGSAHLWRVALHYVIRGGAVTIQPSEKVLHWLNKVPEFPALPSIMHQKPKEEFKDIAPFAHPELPTEFCRLKSGDKNAVLAFVHEYGMLGRNQLSILDFPADRYEAHRHSRETMSWIQNHAKTVEMLLYFIDLLNRKPGVLGKGLKKIASRLFGVEYAVGSLEKPQFFPVFYPIKGGNPKEIVCQLLKAVIEPNIKYLGESLVVEDDETIIRSKSFPALLPVIYSHLADAAVGERIYVKCQYKPCGNYFQQTDRRQRYCPDTVNSKNDRSKNESLCSHRDRQRRYWEKQKRKKSGKKVGVR